MAKSLKNSATKLKEVLENIKINMKQDMKGKKPKPMVQASRQASKDKRTESTLGPQHNGYHYPSPTQKKQKVPETKKPNSEPNLIQTYICGIIIRKRITLHSNTKRRTSSQNTTRLFNIWQKLKLRNHSYNEEERGRKRNSITHTWRYNKNLKTKHQMEPSEVV